MALKSGELANLQVPKETYAKIDAWLNSAVKSRAEPHEFRYNPLAADTPEQRHGLTATKTMTSVGLLMRLYGGFKRKQRSDAERHRLSSQICPRSARRENRNATRTIGTMARRSCITSAANIGKPGTASYIRCWSIRKSSKGRSPAVGNRGPCSRSLVGPCRPFVRNHDEPSFAGSSLSPLAVIRRHGKVTQRFDSFKLQQRFSAFVRRFAPLR